MSTFAPIFATLDAMIAAGWGDIPRIHIPENWREIPREVNQDDCQRIMAEQLRPERERIAEIEKENSRASVELAARVLHNERERRKRGRPRVRVSEAWIELVAERRLRRLRRVS